MQDVREGEYRKKWKLMKLAVHGSTIQYTARRKKSYKIKVDVLERKLARLESELLKKNYLFQDTEEQ